MVGEGYEQKGNERKGKAGSRWWEGEEESDCILLLTDSCAICIHSSQPHTRTSHSKCAASSNAVSNRQATVKYYEGKPQLGQYTVTTELSRMAYSIVPPNGTRLHPPYALSGTDIDHVSYPPTPARRRVRY
eukprot:2360494-Rhodomonas_salina.2